MSLPLFLMAAGMSLSAAGQGLDIVQKRKELKYQERLYRSQAAEVERMAALDEWRTRRYGETVLSSQRSGYAKAGVDLDSGSPLEVMAETAAQIDLDARIIKYNGAMEAARLRNEARMARYNRKMGTITGILNMGASLLGKVGSMPQSGLLSSSTSSSSSSLSSTPVVA